MKINEVRLNKHQTHMCDLVFTGDFDELNNYILSFLRSFETGHNDLNVTTKIDGSPAVICYSKIEGYPDNSICLKSFTNGPQNCMSSLDEIDGKYADRPDMAKKLMYALQLARYIPEGEAWQGDCLFTQDDLIEREIDGKKYITFQPNKIVYAFAGDNEAYEKIMNSQFGIAFHTIYKGVAGNFSQSFKVDATRLNAPDTFYIMSPALNVSTDKKDYDLDQLKTLYAELLEYEDELSNDPAFRELIDNETFIGFWNTFENSNLSDKQAVNLNVSTFYNDLVDYIRDKRQTAYDKKVATLKTERGKENAKTSFDKETLELSDLLTRNKDTLTTMVKALNCAANIKMIMLKGYTSTGQSYNTYLHSRIRGYVETQGEGIAMSDDDGNIVKLVDRSTFSNANRSDEFTSGWEHNESLEEEEITYE